MNHDMSFHVCIYIYMCVCVKYVYQEVQSMSQAMPLPTRDSLAKPSQAPSPATSVRDPQASHG